MFGSGYVIDHCISAFVQSQKEKAYKVYVTDALMYISHNTASKQGDMMVTKRFIDIMTPQKEDDRTGDEVALEVIRKLGLKVKENVAV